MLDIKKAVRETRKIDNEYSYFNVICEDLAKKQAEENEKSRKKGRLSDYIISVKDCICVKGVETTAGSRILNEYRPLFNAAVVERCIAEGGIIIGKTTQDEFGFGGFNINVGIGYKIPKNPFDKHRACGGSSGGAAGFTKKISELNSQLGIKHIALAESTGGSIVNPACFCGVFGLCPTYSLVSRYGLIDYASSMDKIGPIGSSIKDVALLLEIISGYDEKDSTSYKISELANPPYTRFVNQSLKGKKIGLIKETMQNLDENVEKGVWDAVKKLENEGVKYEEISLPFTQKYGLSAYYIIAMAESSTNLAKYCGLRYGKHGALSRTENFNDYFSEVRSMNFGREAKRRIILGTFTRMAGYRDEYYFKALKIRTMIIEEYKKHLKKFNALISPAVPILPPLFKEIEKLTPLQNYMMDVMTTGPNLAGLPHLNVPVGFAAKEGKQLPLGALLITEHFNEGELIQLGSVFDKNK